MQLSKWAEFIGIVAVVISLGLLTWELNQANSLGRFTVAADISRHYNEMNLEMASSREFGELAAAFRGDPKDLSEPQVQQAIAFAFWNRNVWINAERGYQEGWITRNAFQATLNDIGVVASQWPALRPHMRYVVESMGRDRELSEVERRIMDATQ
ncbi:MAG: hypothetical protein RIC56_22925 [Pseudomonadales bacterium]